MPPPCYRFAEFTLSPARRALFRSGREVPLIPRYLDLLVLLVERRSVALHRQEILERVWADVVVSDGALSQAVRTLRRTLGEDGKRVFVRTVSRHGYQFVCPVVEETDGGEAPVPADVPAGPAPGGASDPVAEALARLLDPAAEEDVRREAAEELHALGTAEALRRLDRAPGHARAWAHLRDSRWDVAGAGSVPPLAPPAGPAAWAALAGLRLRRALRLVGSRWASASVGGAAAGALAGLLGGLAMAGLGASLATSLLGALALVGALVAGAGAAGVGCGLAAAEALVRSWRTSALVGLGAQAGPWPGYWRVALPRGCSRGSSASTASPPAAVWRACAWAPRPGWGSVSPRGGSPAVSRRLAGERGRGRSPPPPSRARSPPPACPPPGGVSAR